VKRKKPQISPPRYAPVEMTFFFEGRRFGFSLKLNPSMQQIRHPDRSCHGFVAHTRCEKRLGPATNFQGTIALSFVIPSEAEGSAVQRPFLETLALILKQNCHLDRSAA
jgi:hypothetical protein